MSQNHKKNISSEQWSNHLTLVNTKLVSFKHSHIKQNHT